MAQTQTVLVYALFGIISLNLCLPAIASFPYYGTKIGSLKRLHHGVSGDVYAVDSRTIFLKSFNYDGEAPAAYFYVGNTNKPSNEGASRLRDERGGTASLVRRYRNKDITLSLPEGKTLRDIKWFSVWCDEFAVNFGDVAIPNNLDYPRPQKISALKGVHGVSSENVVIVDAQTLLVPNFSYDGEAPDAKFWVGRGQRPTSQGLRIPDENGKENPLRRYDRKTIVLTLPGDLTIFDVGHFGVWCEAFTVDFGHVRIPEGLNVPPSLKMLGISPQSKLNCEVLYDDLAFEVRWAVAGESIVVQLVAKLANNEYMSFGISPNKDRSEMIGSDVVVSWVDKDTGKGFAQDYYLDDKSQCSGGRGTCPDVNLEDNTNSVRLLNAAMVNGYSIVTYQRSLQATDKWDLPISINGSEAIVWAIGPLNERKEVSFHTHYTKRTHYIYFGRQPTWNCPMPEGSTKSPGTSDESTEAGEEGNRRDAPMTGYPPAGVPQTVLASEPEEEFYDNRDAQALQRPNRRQERPSVDTTAQRTQRPVPTPKPVNSNDLAWDIPAIQCYEPEDGVFYAQMGPTGGKHGYPAITGHVGWGISWYINGLLIPEIHVVRGKTYTFVVEGGNNPDIPAKYHPFYITDDPVGGYEHKREEEKKAVRIFAGVHRSRSGQVTPTGVGRLCNWTPDVDGPPADDYQSFGAYQRTLTLKCDPGEPGVITWKPDQNTPDTVYYHCFTHRYLGWKIHVHDSCDDARYAVGAASEKHEVRVVPTQEDITAESSIRHETKVSPNDNFLLKHQTDLIKNHNMNGTPPKLTFEITKSSEITKLISDGIRAAEALEESILRNNNDKYKVGQTGGATPNSNNPNGPYKQQPSLKQQTVANSPPQVVPPKPYISTVAPANLQGETHIHLYHNNLPHIHAQSHLPSSYSHHPHHHNLNNLTNLPAHSQKTIGLSEYLRPPQNAPLFHPVKLPSGRRPYPGPVKKVPASKPVLPQQMPPRHPQVQPQQHNSAIPQPSVIVNHYRKPLPGLLKPFLKEKLFPIQPIAASVLLLGQPTDLGGGNHLYHNQRKTELILQQQQQQHHSKTKPKPVIPVPYKDLVPQDTRQSNVYALNGQSNKQEKNPGYQVKFPSHMLEKAKPVSLPQPSTSTLPTAFKKPFDIHEVIEEPSSLDIATMKPAVNNGFKPDTVIVESGFRPIIRLDGGVMLPEELVDQIAHRREDPGSEIDEVMETDTLFLTAQSDPQPQHFEPMFIPSPPDSTNSTIIIRKAAVPPGEHTPIAAKLRNATLDDLMQDADVSKEILPHENKIVQKDNLPIEVNVTDKNESEFENEADDNPNLSDEKDVEELKHTMEQQKDEIDDMDLEELFENIAEFEEEELEEDEKVAQAAERIDTYYLPPDNRKIPHTNIPNGAVITFDGKPVVDSSLVLPPKLELPTQDRDTSNLRRQNYQGLSKLEQYIRNTPQFSPFRGEIPAEIREFLSTERSLQSARQTSITAYSNPLHPTSNSDGSLLSPSTSPLPSSSSSQSLHTQSSSLPSYISSSSSPSTSSRPISTKLHILKNSA